LGVLGPTAEAQAGGGYSVYIWNCSHPSYGWQRAGFEGEADVSQAAATRAMQRRQQTGPSYERYSVFRATSQRISASAPNCGGSPPRQYCIYYAKMRCWGREGWLGGYNTLSLCQYYAQMYQRSYGCSILGYYQDCR
jgi:hypothetical protein